MLFYRRKSIIILKKAIIRMFKMKHFWSFLLSFSFSHKHADRNMVGEYSAFAGGGDNEIVQVSRRA